MTHPLLSRSEAIASGSSRYFTGKPCKYGHIALRKTINNNCCSCRREYRRSSPAHRAANRRLCKERTKNATPNWVDRKAMHEFFRFCPEGCHVDHIIPLKGRNVCGLNVLENLQYLDAAENFRKSNKVDPVTLDVNVCVLPEYRTYGD